MMGCSNSPSSTARLLELNASAVKHLLVGNRSAALITLQEALNSARELVVQEESANPSNPVQTPMLQSVAVATVSSNECSMIMFDRVFHLLPPTTGPVDSLETTAILLYNMAFCYQQAGMMTGNSSHLTKSLKLYEMALLMFDEESSALHLVPGLELLQLGLYNNIAVLHRHFLNLEKASLFEERLRWGLSAWNASPCGPVAGEEVTLFAVNVFFAQNQALRSAPAA